MGNTAHFCGSAGWGGGGGGGGGEALRPPWTDWQTPLKTLRSRNFVCIGNKFQEFLHELYTPELRTFDKPGFHL